MCCICQKRNPEDQDFWRSLRARDILGKKQEYVMEIYLNQALNVASGVDSGGRQVASSPKGKETVTTGCRPK